MYRTTHQLGEISKTLTDGTAERRGPALVRFFIICGLLLSVLCGCRPTPNIQEQRQALAEQLGVAIDNYPYPSVFPWGYFQQVLPQGSSIETVHRTIAGYVKVLKCEEGGRREVYYYFDDGDHTALRIEVWYSETYKVIHINSEDDDSRTIYVEDCEEGQLA